MWNLVAAHHQGPRPFFHTLLNILRAVPTPAPKNPYTSNSPNCPNYRKGSKKRPDGHHYDADARQTGLVGWKYRERVSNSKRQWHHQQNGPCADKFVGKYH